MNRILLQQLAEERVADAQALLAAGRWSGAYYLAGYAVECGLKSCVLALIVNTGVMFQDKRFAERCWTHNLDDLHKLAGLEAEMGQHVAGHPTFGMNWLTVKDWSELSRYEQTPEPNARAMYDAVNDPANGVLTWIKKYW